MEVQRGEKAKIIACTNFTCNKAASAYTGEAIHIAGCDTTCVAQLTAATTTAAVLMSTDVLLRLVCSADAVTLYATSCNSSTNLITWHLTVFQPIA